MSLIIKKNTTFKIPRTVPSGFPNVEADGQQIAVSSVSNPSINGIYTKTYGGGPIVHGNTNASRIYTGPYFSNGSYNVQIIFNTNTNRWEIGNILGYGDGVDNWELSSFSSSSNQNVIPTTGWDTDIIITAA
jgi:hypothetical protein